MVEDKNQDKEDDLTQDKEDELFVQRSPGDSGDDKGAVILRAAANEQSPTVGYVRFHIPLAEIAAQDDELEFRHDLDIQVATRVLGLEAVHLTSARPGYPDPLAGQVITPENK